jgi:hypothetical protein
MFGDSDEEKKKLMKMAGRGSLNPQHSNLLGPNEIISSGQTGAPKMSSYWKNYKSTSTDILLDASERKKHAKDYGLGAHEKKDFRKRAAPPKKSLSSGTSTARYIPLMR